MNIAFKDRHTPIYSQVATLFRRRIADGVWATGEQIPTIETLMSELGVARATVRHALQLLETDGLIDRRRGRGTYVTAVPHEAPMLTVQADWTSFVKELSADEPRLVETFEATEAPAFAAEFAELLPKYQLMRRISLKQGIPFLYGDYYVDQERYARAPERFQRAQIIPVLDAIPGVRIKTVRQTLTIGTADLETASYLEVPVNAPVGRVRRIAIDTNGTALLIAEVTYRGDLVQLDMTVKR